MWATRRYKKSYIKNIFFLYFFSFSLLGLVFAITFNLAGKGLYLGILLVTLITAKDNNFNKSISHILIIGLIVNLLTIISNLLFSEYFIVPPIFSSGQDVYLQDIRRMVDIFGVEIKIKRPTGISDNIHVSGLILLCLAYYSKLKKWRYTFSLACLIILITVNLQIIISLIAWIFLGLRKKVNLRLSKIILSICLSAALILIIDYLFMEGWYISMVSNTFGGSMGDELDFYSSYAEIINWIFGIPPWAVEDPYDKFTYGIPLTDIGIIGFPIQHGIYGTLMVISYVYFLYINSPASFKLFFIAVLIMIIHYFSVASLPGIIYLTWLSYCKPADYNK